MTEFDDIFADPLNTVVYVYGSFVFLAAYAAAALALMRRSRTSWGHVGQLYDAYAATPLRGRYPD